MAMSCDEEILCSISNEGSSLELMLGLGFGPSECRREEDFGVSQRFSGRLSRKTLLPGYNDGEVEICLP